MLRTLDKQQCMNAKDIIITYVDTVAGLCHYSLYNHYAIIICMVSFEKNYNQSKSITEYYAIPTNYTSTGVTVGRGARSPIERQPVIASPQSSN